MSSHMESEVIGTIWFDDASSYPQSVALIEEVSELLWGANDDGTREPYSMEESIERMKEYTTKSYAWDLLVEFFEDCKQIMKIDAGGWSLDDLIRIMDSSMKEAKGESEE